MKTCLQLLLLLNLFVSCAENGAKQSLPATAKESSASTEQRWSAEKASAYVAARPWQLGANFNPRDAINQLEMWQAETFNPTMIDEELGWAADIGMNSMRVYLHNYPWEQDSAGFLRRIGQYLDVADSHGIATTFVLFDAVWDPVSKPGPQPAPRPRVHNSGWVQSPSSEQLMSGSTYYPAAKNYVQGILRHFANDNRIFMWDLYNEPDNNNFSKFPNEPQNKADFVFPLLEKTFAWARQVNPSQPLTSGVWFGDLFNKIDEHLPLNRFNEFQLNHSDIISYHSYRDSTHHRKVINRLSQYGRPLVCTEYLARTHGSTFETFLPVFKAERIGAYNWGLVAGKTQTNYPWSSWDSTFTAEPHLWHHEVFRSDGTPYKDVETELIRGLTGK